MYIRCYNKLKNSYIKKLLNKFFFINNNVNIYYINLLKMYLLNKNYKYCNFSTNILIFNNINKLFKSYNDLILCNLLIEKEYKIYNINLLLYYSYLIIYGVICLQNIEKFLYFLKI